MSKIGHLKFARFFPKKYRKTKIYKVLGYQDAVLGTIIWNPSWRQYWFEPIEQTGWTDDCTLELYNFLHELKKERKRK